MEPIIDFHMHPYLTKEQNYCFYKEFYDYDVNGYVEQIKKAGITHICGSVIEGRHKVDDFSYLRNLNRIALQLKEILGDFYTPGFHIHPAFYEESIEEIDFMHEHGVKLIGELVPYMHDWNEFDVDSFHRILSHAEGYHMVCNYHTPFEFDMNETIASHPGMNFVAAHPGERDRVLTHIEMMKRHPNLYLDISGTGLMRFGMIHSVIKEVGAKRILFGTDYPITNPGMYVEAVKFENLSDADRTLIFSENAKRLLNLT